MSMKNHGGMISTGKTPDSSIRGLWQSYQQSRLGANQEELGEWNGKFGLQSIFVHTSKRYFICCKISRHGADDFTYPPKECVLRTLTPLKIHHFNRVWTRKSWVNSKHSNHYTTEMIRANINMSLSFPGKKVKQSHNTLTEVQGEKMYSSYSFTDSVTK
jgi:hypothetical protein